MSALTNWFAGDVRPERPGAYETKSADHERTWFQYWNGTQWGAYCTTPAIAEKDANFRSARQFPLWRGLASDPSVTP
jgi:hypothetical protein